MSFLIARLGDGISHGGTIISSASKTTANSQLVARVGDQVNCAIHGLQTITQGSSNLTVEGAKVAYVGALCSCGATIMSGGSNSSCGS